MAQAALGCWWESSGCGWCWQKLLGLAFWCSLVLGGALTARGSFWSPGVLPSRCRPGISTGFDLLVVDIVVARDELWVGQGKLEI